MPRSIAPSVEECAPFRNALYREIERYAAAAERWCRATNRAFTAWALYICLIAGWDMLFGVPTVLDLAARGSPSLFFASWLGWCASKYVNNERLRNLFGAMKVFLDEAPTAKAKAELLRSIEHAIIAINCGDKKRGVCMLKRITRGRIMTSQPRQPRETNPQPR
jgi:hypothetical protein